MLCNHRRVNSIIISAIAISTLLLLSTPIKARAENDNDVDDENVLNYPNEASEDENKCIPQTLLAEHEIEDREIMKTSFIPSYCKTRNSKKDQNGNEDLEMYKWRVRRKRSEDLINFLHLDSMNNLSPYEVRQTQSKIMKRYMNPAIDPCVDFYNYACGNWARYNSIPSDKVAYDTFEILREYLDQALHELLLSDKQEVKKHQKRHQRTKKRNRRSHDNRVRRQEKNAELKAKNLFQSCMNYNVIEKRGIEPLKELLKSLGGWPLLDRNWNEKDFDWLELVANLRKYNNDILIVEYVSADIQNSNQNIIQFDQTSLGLPTRDYFLKPVNEKYLNSYRNFMTKIINLMGVDVYEASDYADEIIEFETNLANIMSSQEDRTNISVLYQKKTLAELQVEIPGIDFARYLTIVQDRVVDSNEKVIMFAKKYMQQLVKLIAKTEPATVANYILWRFARNRVNNLDNRFLEAKQTFYQECFGREKSPPRWKSCVTQVNSNVGKRRTFTFHSPCLQS
jgi:neprilysin